MSDDEMYLTGRAPIIGVQRGYRANLSPSWSLDAPEAIPHGGTVDPCYPIVWREPETLDPELAF